MLILIIQVVLEFVNCLNVQGQSKVKPFSGFNAKKEAKVVRKAVKGLGLL